MVALHLVPYVQGYDFYRADLDCSILFGDGHWPGVKAHYLTGREQVLIAPPASDGQPLLRHTRDVANFQRLQHVSVPMAWSHWLASHGLEGINPFAGPQMDQFHGVMRAVAAGMGIALVPRCLVQDDIAAGLVSAPLNELHLDDLGYWLCYPEARAQHPALASFRQWILAQCA